MNIYDISPSIDIPDVLSRRSSNTHTNYGHANRKGTKSKILVYTTILFVSLHIVLSSEGHGL